MNTRHLLIALALAVTSSAVTAETYAQSVNAPGKSRAQVVEELKQARAAGLMPAGDANYPALPAFVSTKTRAQVIEELKQARAAGLMPVGDASYPPQAAFVSSKTREQVQAELAEFQKHPDTQGLYQGA